MIWLTDDLGEPILVNPDGIIYAATRGSRTVLQTTLSDPEGGEVVIQEELKDLKRIIENYQNYQNQIRGSS
jgi:hypothetical protein